MSDISDNKDEEDDETGTEDINGNDDDDGGGDRNNGAVGGSEECLRFFIPGVQTEVLGNKEKAKTSSSIASRKKPSWEKLRVR